MRIKSGQFCPNPEPISFARKAVERGLRVPEYVKKGRYDEAREWNDDKKLSFIQNLARINDGMRLLLQQDRFFMGYRFNLCTGTFFPFQSFS
jgi:hypothetical protein